MRWQHCFCLLYCFKHDIQNAKTKQVQYPKQRARTFPFHDKDIQKHIKYWQQQKGYFYLLLEMLLFCFLKQQQQQQNKVWESTK